MKIFLIIILIVLIIGLLIRKYRNALKNKDCCR